MARPMMVQDLDERLVTEAAVRVAAAVLDRSEDAILGDRRRWWVTCSSELFGADTLEALDWENLSFPRGPPRRPSVDRRDLNLSSSRLWVDALLGGDGLDPALRRYLEREPVLSGAQIRSLLQEGRIERRWLALGQFEGCVQAVTDGLVDCIKALLLLHDGAGELFEPEASSVDASSTLLLDTIEPLPLRRHISLFFQSPSAARAEGLVFQSAARRAELRRHLEASLGQPLEPTVAEPDQAMWVNAEGLGSLCLSLRPTVPDVPPRDP